MKIAIFSLTKDRLYYTKKTLQSLKEKTHIPFDHFILDQDSQDKTVEWINGFTHKQGEIYVY